MNAVLRSPHPAFATLTARIVLCLALLWALFAAPAGAAPAGIGAPVVSGVRIGTHEVVTRVVIAISERVPYQVFTLANPDRVVVDLPAVRWAIRPEAEPRPGGVFDRLRHGRYKPDVSRLVIDCREPVTIRDSELSAARGGTYRLVIDLAPATRAPSTADSAAAGGGAPAPSPTPSPTPPPVAAIGLTGLPTGDGPPPAAASGNDSGSGAAPVIGRTAMMTATAAATPVPPARPRPTAGKRNPAPQRWVVAIDPGHGGADPGAIGLSGIHEKQITLATARALRDELAALGRYRAVMTRNRDVFIRLRDRIAVARAAGASLFVSLHADKMHNTAVRGLSVYTLSERASDAEAAALAEQENKSDLLAGVNLGAESPEVTNILIDLVQRETMNQSSVLAAALVRELREQTLLLPKTHRFAGFAVLKAPDVPSVLVELGYLSNPADERLLRSDAHRRKLAKAIARAIDGYFVRVEARNRQ